MSHKVYQLPRAGGSFELVDGPKPKVEAANEVLVKTKAVALNPLDVLQANHGFMVEQWPTVLGYDGSGIVEEVGKDVKGLKVGDAVFGPMAQNGKKSKAFQEYIVAQEKHLAKKPENVSFEDAASLGIGYATGLSAVYNGLGTPLPFIPNGAKEGYKPKFVLVVGGSSSVGAATVRLLRLILPQAIILATSSAKQHELIKKLGGVGIDRSSSTIVEDIRSLTPNGEGVDAIVDCVGGVGANKDILEAFNPSGPRKLAEVVTGTSLQESPEGVQHKAIFTTALWSSNVSETAVPALGDLLNSGKWPIPIPTQVVGQGWERIPEGLKILENGVSGTKIVISI